MDYERTSAPYDSSPPPLRPFLLDWLVRLRLRARGGTGASVLVGAGAAALIYAVGSALLNVFLPDGVLGDGFFPPQTEGLAVLALLLSDAVGGLTIGVMAQRHTLLTAVLTGFTLRLPRLLRTLRLLVVALAAPHREGIRLYTLVGPGTELILVLFSIMLWLIAASFGSLFAERRLDSLGLR